MNPYVIAGVVGGLLVAAFVTLIVLMVGFQRPGDLHEIASSEDVGVRHADAPSQTNDSPGSAHGFRPNYASAPGTFSGGQS